MTNILTKIIKANQEYEILGGGSSSAGEEHEVITQAAYDALTPAQKAEKVYMIKKSGTPGTVLTAGAGIDITNNEISVDTSTAPYDNTTSGATATNVQDAIDEVFQSVSNGKTIIAAAITDKGVSTAATDSFQTMATNIGLIQTECPSSVVSILSDDGEGATKYFVIQDNSAVNVGSYVDKKNVKGKDVYMISAVNGQNNGGNMKIVIVDQNGNVTFKKFTGINVYKHTYCSTIKYLPLSNAIAIMGEFSSTSTHGGAVSIAIDFDTYENASLVYNDPYDDSYLDTVQGNGGIDFLQYNAKVGDNKVGYALMSPIML